MTAVGLLSDVQSRGVEVRVEGNLLRLRARKGVVDADILARLAAHKAEIISILTGKVLHRARVRGQEFIEQAYAPDICWHCQGSRSCDCALCGCGLPGNWKASQCGACQGAGYLTWGAVN